MILAEKEIITFERNMTTKSIKINCTSNLEYRKTDKGKLKMGYHLKILLDLLRVCQFRGLTINKEKIKIFQKLNLY